MSLTQDHGDHVFQCDGKGCRTVLQTNTSNFESARNLMKRARWQPIKRTGNPSSGDGEWQHLCPACQHGGQLYFAHGKPRSENAGAP